MLEQKFEFDEDNEDKVPFEFHYNYFKSRRVAYEKGMEENDWIYDDDDFGEYGDEEDDDTEWEYWDNSQELKNRYVCMYQMIIFSGTSLFISIFYLYLFFIYIILGNQNT